MKFTEAKSGLAIIDLLGTEFMRENRKLIKVMHNETSN